MSRVLVLVNGGVAEVLVEDENTQILIVDYDIDGVKAYATDKDPDGRTCVVTSPSPEMPAIVAKYFDHFKPTEGD